MRELILQDKARAEAETAKVREDLIQTSAKVSTVCTALSFEHGFLLFFQLPHPSKEHCSWTSVANVADLLSPSHVAPYLQLASERERSAVRLQEERERAERDQQAALAEAVKGQALLRAELASTVQRMQVVFLLCSSYISTYRHIIDFSFIDILPFRWTR